MTANTSSQYDQLRCPTSITCHNQHDHCSNDEKVSISSFSAFCRTSQGVFTQKSDRSHSLGTGDETSSPRHRSTLVSGQKHCRASSSNSGRADLALRSKNSSESNVHIQKHRKIERIKHHKYDDQVSYNYSSRPDCQTPLADECQIRTANSDGLGILSAAAVSRKTPDSSSSFSSSIAHQSFQPMPSHCNIFSPTRDHYSDYNFTPLKHDRQHVTISHDSRSGRNHPYHQYSFYRNSSKVMDHLSS
eukprot:6991930-Ditylum_brightwellii.AAC.1